MSNLEKKLEPDFLTAYIAAIQRFAAVMDAADGADILLIEAILVPINDKSVIM